MTDDARLEQAYENGRRMAWLLMLQDCLRHLGAEERSAHGWVAERTSTIHMLRLICAACGDNDWDEKLHLADILEKHLWPYLETTED